MTTFTSDPDLSGQFALIRRDFVTSGRLAELNAKDEGVSVSLVPIMALLSWGRPDEATHCRTSRLRRLAGVDCDQLQRARKTLQATGVVELADESRRGVWSFRTGDCLRAAASMPRFRFTGAIVGHWPALQPSEKSLLLALAANAKPLLAESLGYAGRDDMSDLGQLPTVVRAWLEESDAVELGRHEIPLVRRTGTICLSRLAVWTGFAEESLESGLNRLVARGLVLASRLDGDHWYHLPAAYWHVTSGSSSYLASLSDDEQETHAGSSNTISTHVRPNERAGQTGVPAHFVGPF